MKRFNVGDEVRIDIPEKNDPDFERLHGCHGTVSEVLEDDAGFETGDPRDSVLYRVELVVSGEVVDLRWRDLRPL
jgi:hypothetical protein